MSIRVDLRRPAACGAGRPVAVIMAGVDPPAEQLEIVALPPGYYWIRYSALYARREDAVRAATDANPDLAEELLRTESQ